MNIAYGMAADNSVFKEHGSSGALSEIINVSFIYSAYEMRDIFNNRSTLYVSELHNYSILMYLLKCTSMCQTYVFCACTYSMYIYFIGL